MGNNKPRDMSELFAEYDAEQMEAHKARVASGEDAEDMRRLLRKGAEERRRLEAHGCIENTQDEEE